MIDKEHAPRWNPVRIEDVAPETVQAYFGSSLAAARASAARPGLSQGLARAGVAGQQAAARRFWPLADILVALHMAAFDPKRISVTAFASAAGVQIHQN